MRFFNVFSLYLSHVSFVFVCTKRIFEIITEFGVKKKPGNFPKRFLSLLSWAFCWNAKLQRAFASWKGDNIFKHKWIWIVASALWMKMRKMLHICEHLRGCGEKKLPSAVQTGAWIKGQTYSGTLKGTVSQLDRWVFFIRIKNVIFFNVPEWDQLLCLT